MEYLLLDPKVDALHVTEKRDVSLLGQFTQTENAALADQCLELTDE